MRQTGLTPYEEVRETATREVEHPPDVVSILLSIFYSFKHVAVISVTSILRLSYYTKESCVASRCLVDREKSTRQILINRLGTPMFTISLFFFLFFFTYDSIGTS